MFIFFTVILLTIGIEFYIIINLHIIIDLQLKQLEHV